MLSCIILCCHASAHFAVIHHSRLSCIILVCHAWWWALLHPTVLPYIKICCHAQYYAVITHGMLSYIILWRRASCCVVIYFAVLLCIIPCRHTSNFWPCIISCRHAVYCIMTSIWKRFFPTVVCSVQNEETILATSLLASLARRVFSLGKTCLSLLRM